MLSWAILGINFILCGQSARLSIQAALRDGGRRWFGLARVLGGIQATRYLVSFCLRRGKMVALGIALILGWLCVPHLIRPLLGSWYILRCDGSLATEPERAIRFAAEADKLAPDCGPVQLRRAKCLHMLAQAATGPRQVELYRHAVAAVDQACRIEPKCAAYHANRGRILGDAARLRLSTPTEVFAAFDLAIELDPFDTVCLADAAAASVSLGVPQLGQSYLQHGLQLDDNLAYLHAEMGAMLMLDKKWALAKTRLELSLELNWHGDDHAS